MILAVVLLLLVLGLQAVYPWRRMVIVIFGAALACLLATATGTATTREILEDVPWDVLVILIALGWISEVFVTARVFPRLAVSVARFSGGDPRWLLPVIVGVMWGVSGLVNNVTALLLILPIVHILLSLMGVDQRYVRWLLGMILVACNLGGAATPIGDFPAVLLLGSGALGFTEYLLLAAPPTAIALVLLVTITMVVVRPARALPSAGLSARLSVATMTALYRNVRLDVPHFGVAGAILGGMIVAWMAAPPQFGPELVAWLGVGVLLATQGARGEELARRSVDVEASLFLLAMFVMVGVVRRAGVFAAVAGALLDLPVSDELRLVAFLLTTGVLTGLFSAGPSMAALLEVAGSLAQTISPSAVYVGLALSVCAGSSLFLTAATSGPLAQSLTERANLRGVGGEPLRLGFLEFLPVGLLSFAVIQGVAIAWALMLASFG
jgi:Na+/H+ antiporter NhaD/arsenite permease-like protein